MSMSKLYFLSCEKDLEVLFDNSLSFKEHIVSKVKKANSMVGLIKKEFLTSLSRSVSDIVYNICQTTFGIRTSCLVTKTLQTY